MFTIFVLKALCSLFPDSEAEAPHPHPPIPLITKFSKHNPYGVAALSNLLPIKKAPSFLFRSLNDSNVRYGEGNGNIID